MKGAMWEDIFGRYLANYSELNAKVKRYVYSFLFRIFRELASLILTALVFQSLRPYLTKAGSPIFLQLLLETSNKQTAGNRSFEEK